MASEPQHHVATTVPKLGNQVIATAFAVYGTLCLLLVTIPGSVVGWLDERDNNFVQQGALRAAETVQRASEYVGLSAPYIRLRAVFLERIRGE